KSTEKFKSKKRKQLFLSMVKSPPTHTHTHFSISNDKLGLKCNPEMAGKAKKQPHTVTHIMHANTTPQQMSKTHHNTLMLYF
uniref:Uncharacterized protein n=1 Tax=Astyanax mexicanus TaxID=7994 RepID=A0A3B1J4U7_ASTMX